jgi:hypothetical protein
MTTGALLQHVPFFQGFQPHSNSVIIYESKTDREMHTL